MFPILTDAQLQSRARAIRSVTEDVRLNRPLWRLTEHFTELKAAA
jgi:hypothetical protein